MPEPGLFANDAQEESRRQPPPRNQDEVALDLMKFIAVTTGYGKAAQGGAGFSGKPGAHSSDDYAEALLGLFERCRRVVKGEK